MTKERAITYARISGRDPGEGSSLDTQAEACQKFAEDQDWSVVGEYRDDLSGVTPLDRRPGLSAAYTFCIADGISALVIFDVDRLARDNLQRALILDAFARLEVKIVFVRGGSTATPEDQIFVGMKGIFADYERLQILERMTRGKLARVKSGKPLVFGRPPFGYVAETERDPRTKKVTAARLVINEDQATVVRRIFNEYIAGSNMQAIATGLCENGTPSYADQHPRMHKKTHGSGIWGRSAVRNVLINESYHGKWHYGKTRQVTLPNGDKKRVRRPREEWIPVDVPKIVDDDTWVRAQALLTGNHKPGREPAVRHPLQRRIFCVHCGRRFSRQVTHKGKPKRAYVYFRCNGSRGRLDNPTRVCDSGPVNGPLLEAAVRDWVTGLALDPDEIRRRYDEQIYATEPLTIELDRVSERIEREELALQRILDEYAYGKFEKDALDSQRDAIQARLDTQLARRAELEGQISQTVDEDAIWEILLSLEELVDYLRGETDDPAIPVEMLMDVYSDLELNVRVDSLDPDEIRVTMASRLGSFTSVLTPKTV